jgi:hypothetical protein
MFYEKMRDKQTDDQGCEKYRTNVQSPNCNQLDQEQRKENARHQEHFSDVHSPVFYRSDSDEYQISKNEKHPCRSSG